MIRRPAIALVVIAELSLALGLPSVVDVAVAVEPAAMASGGTWGTAQGVPGLGALGAIGSGVNSVSCPSPGNCAAVGEYGDGGSLRAFVVDEVSGSWGNAQRVPGINLLSDGRGAQIVSVSCASPGNCAAVGDYTTSRGSQVFVVSEVNGSWRRALAIPGLATLTGRGPADAEAQSISCGAPGNCAAIGNYYTKYFTGVIGHGFVVSEVHGSWHRAVLVRVHGSSVNLEVLSVSCGATRYCVASGDGNYDAFVMTARNGAWQPPVLLRFGGSVRVVAQIWSVSCRGSGSCAAGGHYFDASSKDQAFVVSETNGAWGKALKVPGTGVLNTGGLAEVRSVSCDARASCAAGGYYEDRAGRPQPFVVSEVNGTWRKARQVLGIPAPYNSGALNSISCGAPGNCTAGGYYGDAAGNDQGFVVSEVNGAWGKIIDVPGLRALNVSGRAAVGTISCSAADTCAAGGYYDVKTLSQAFVVVETPATVARKRI
jgi:hypothetical protein